MIITEEKRKRNRMDVRRHSFEMQPYRTNRRTLGRSTRKAYCSISSNKKDSEATDLFSSSLPLHAFTRDLQLRIRCL